MLTHVPTMTKRGHPRGVGEGGRGRANRVYNSMIHVHATACCDDYERETGTGDVAAVTVWADVDAVRDAAAAAAQRMCIVKATRQRYVDVCVIARLAAAHYYAVVASVVI